jgi:hypothetical protein
MSARMAIVSWSVVLLLGQPALSQESADVLVREDFFAGIMLNDMTRFERGMKKAEEVMEQEPNNAEMMVWHGAGQFFRAGIAFRSGDFQSGRALQAQGLARMQQAVDLAPNNVRVRVARGAALLNSSRYMPPQAGRALAETGVGDYEKTLAIQMADFDSLSTHSKGELLLGLADGWLRVGNADKARGYFEMMSKDATLQGSEYESKGRAWLAGAPESKTPAFFQCVGCHKTVAK